MGEGGLHAMHGHKPKRHSLVWSAFVFFFFFLNQPESFGWVSHRREIRTREGRMPENLGEKPALPVAFSTETGFAWTQMQFRTRILCESRTKGNLSWLEAKPKQIRKNRIFSYPIFFSLAHLMPATTTGWPIPSLPLEEMGLWWMVHAEKQVCQEQHI